jgi:hypothetical protein
VAIWFAAPAQLAARNSMSAETVADNIWLSGVAISAAMATIDGGPEVDDRLEPDQAD